MNPPIEEFLEIIKLLPVKEIIAYLIVHGITKLGPTGYEKIKKIIQDKWNEKKYAFVPTKGEAQLIQEFQKHPIYRQVYDLVPKYRHLDMIKTGLLIDHYHRDDSSENAERVKNIKLNVLCRPNGRKLLKLVTLPATPFFSLILNHLYTLKNQGYSANILEEMLDEIVQYWEKTTKLVRAEESIEDVISFCMKQITDKSDIFIVLGMKTASTTVEKALNQLKNALQTEGYNHVLTKSTEGNQPRTEVMFSKKILGGRIFSG